MYNLEYFFICNLSVAFKLKMYFFRETSDDLILAQYF